MTLAVKLDYCTSNFLSLQEIFLWNKKNRKAKLFNSPPAPSPQKHGDAAPSAAYTEDDSGHFACRRYLAVFNFISIFFAWHVFCVIVRRLFSKLAATAVQGGGRWRQLPQSVAANGIEEKTIAFSPEKPQPG
jgi:hypothetical protein